MRAALAFGLALAAAPLGPATAQQPIVGDGDWTLDMAASGCFARLPGPAVDTMVMVNRDAKPVLSIGHPDWHLGTTAISAELSIDGCAPHKLTVSPIDTIVIVSVPDDLRDQVLNARRLTWTLPNGVFTASVAGVGKAFQAVIPCGLPAAQALPPPG